MEKQTILFISDMRQVKLAEILIKQGKQVRCLDVRGENETAEQLEKLKEFLPDTDTLVFPIPISKIANQNILNDILMKDVEKNTAVLGGCFSKEQLQIFEQRGICYHDFMKDTIVQQENAIATAEGTIANIIVNSPYNIENAKILVCGYGNCGKVVAEKLKNLGARVTVLARRKISRREAKKDGFYAVDFAFGPEEAMGAAAIVNTVPAPVVSKYMIRELPKDAYIIDIASIPGGTDFAFAKECGVKAELVLGIPGKYAPKESAYILSRSMERFERKRRAQRKNID